MIRKWYLGDVCIPLDTLEYEVKWALGSITTTRASGGD